VDADPELAELCARMRETGRTSCAILFCEEDVLVESRGPASFAGSARSGVPR
jgi:hypothetical protein